MGVNVVGDLEFEEELERFDQRTQRVLRLSRKLCAIPSVTVPKEETDFEAVNATADVIERFALAHGLKVIKIPAEDGESSPFLIITFGDNDPANLKTDVAFLGHFDVVPAQDEDQFNPRIEDDMFVGRGTADMKTVVVSYLVWMAEQQAKPGENPPFTLTLSPKEWSCSACCGYWI